MKIEFEGKTVIVTGAAHGIGRAITASFAARGAQVFACDVNNVGLADTQRICGDSCETVLWTWAIKIQCRPPCQKLR